ncbi:u3 small nucleolar rna-associated [Nannochloropsis oceanica]
MRGLNDAGGRNRLRFQKLKSRVKHERRRIDVVHKTKSLGFIFDDKDEEERRGNAKSSAKGISLDIIPKSGCLFQDHIQAYLELNPSRAFQRLGKDLAPLSRSLPEVLHHLSGIVLLLTTHLTANTWGPAHENALLLVAVLAKEVGAELYVRGHFRPLMDALLNLLDPLNPEATARAVQAMAHLFTHLSKPLLVNLDVLKRYYGPLLGHKKEFVRKYAAEALAGLLRRLGDKQIGKHIKGVIKAAAAAIEAQHRLDGGKGGKSMERRGGYLIDGLALLVFLIVRGIQSQGQLHSKAVPVLRILFLQEAKGKEDEALGLVQRKVVEGMLTYLCPHLKPPHAGPVWTEALTAVGMAPREEGGDVNGLERSVHVLVALLRYRNGWLLSHEEVRQAQVGGLSEVVSELGSLDMFSLLGEAAKAEVVYLISALWEWQTMRRQRRMQGMIAEEDVLREALVEATGVVLGPESGADPELVGELATRVLVLGGCMEDSGRASLVVNACLSRAVSPKCPLAAWLDLLRALLDEEGGGEGGREGVLRHGKRELVDELASDLMGRIEGVDKTLTERITALRCLPSVLAVNGSTSTPPSPSLLALKMKATRMVQALVEEEGGEEFLVNQAAIALMQLWALDDSSDINGISSSSSTDGSINNNKQLKKGKKPSTASSSSSPQHKQQKQDLAKSLWKRLQTSPSSLVAVRALTVLFHHDHSLVSFIPVSEALSLLSSNLHSPSHLLRLSTLRLVVTFPTLPFRDTPVGGNTNNGNSNSDGNSSNKQDKETSFTGPCPALATCLELEATPITISAERSLGMLLNRLEVWAGSRRLPGSYLGPLASYCLGLLHVRYAELWPLAAKTFAALSHACSCAEETQIVWTHVVTTMVEVDGRLVKVGGSEGKGESEKEEGGLEKEGAASDCMLRLVANNGWGVNLSPSVDEIKLVSFVLQESSAAMGGGPGGAMAGEASKLGATDPLTSLRWVFDSIKRCLPLLTRKSSELAGLFVAFLQHQYFTVFTDDPEALELKGDLCRFLEEQQQQHKLQQQLQHLLMPARLRGSKVARSKLLAFLKMFAVGGVPKQGPGRALLQRIFAGFLSRPDNAVAVAALDCLINQTLPYLTPYAATCKALLDDITLRDELVRFSLATDIQPEHRADFIPLLVRLLFGRFLAKASRARTRSSKDSPAARRAAIVSFLAGSQGENEFREFVHLMLRPFLVDATESFQARENLDVSAASAGRRLGFLHLLGSVVRQMGFHVLPFVDAFLEVTVGLLAEGYRDVGAGELVEEGEEVEGKDDCMGMVKEEGRKGDEIEEAAEEEEEEDVDAHIRRGRSQGTLRLIATRTVSELFVQYAGSFNFTRVAPRLWSVLGPSILRLPAMCSGAQQAPALLDLLLALTQHEALMPVYTYFEATLTPSLLACLSAGQGPPATVAGPVLTIMDRLCAHDGVSHLLPYLPGIVEHVAKRLQLVQASMTNNKDPLLERCLDLLCQTSQLAASARKAAEGKEKEGILGGGAGGGGEGREGGGAAAAAAVDDVTLSSLFGLLLPRLKSPRLLREPSKVLILRAYASLVAHMASPRRDIVLLSKLLGPAGLGSTGFGPSGSLRGPAVAALASMAETHEKMEDLRPVVRMLEELNAPDEEGLEGRNLDVVMPAWAQLADEGQWAALMAGTGGSGLALFPLVAHALACLHDEEVVVRVAAGASLRAMLKAAAGGEEGEWLWLLQAGLLPSLRAGMGQPRDAVRQGYVMVMTELIRTVGKSSTIGDSNKLVKKKKRREGSGEEDDGEEVACKPSWMKAHVEYFHGDLACLVREEDAEADFFHNIIHIQVHRRARTLQRLTKVLNAGGAEPGGEAGASMDTIREGGGNFSSSSLVHVLLPLACQPLLFVDRTIQAKSPDPGLLHEASMATAAVARRLSWSHYNGLIRRFLREISLAEAAPVGQQPASREKALVNGLCHVLDVFHFPMVPPSEKKEMEEVQHPVATDSVAVEKEGKEEKEEDDKEDESQGEDEYEKAAPMASTSDTISTSSTTKNDDVIWRSVTTQLLPSLRGLLLKEGKDKDGGKKKDLRAPMALALLKLIKMLPPTSYEHELTRLLMTVCGTLRSRNSNTRDAAREVLAEMAKDLGPTYLGLIIKELKGALREGYMLHIRIFTLHTVLRALEDVYSPPLDAPSFPVPSAGLMVPPSDSHSSNSSRQPMRPALDACLSDAVALLTEDLFGEAAGAKEAEAEVKSTTIKEAKGQKALDGLEVLSRLLLFRPTYAVASPEDPAALSSVHALVKPFLFQLHDSESPRMHGRVNEALQRVVAGLAVNPSLKAEEVLLYVYGLVSPFVMGGEDEEDEEEEQEGEAENSDEEEEDVLEVIGKAACRPTKQQLKQQLKQQQQQLRSKKEATSWLPVDGTLKLAVEAKKAQRSAAREEARVLDGKNAPKLTGWGRHGAKARRAEGGMFGSPAALAAGVLGLRLLHSYLKRLGQPSKDLVPMLDPYVVLLARCVRRRVNDSIVLLALKCLALMLRYPSSLPCLTYLAPRLVRSSLSLLSMAGGPANSRDEIVQSCLKILTILIAASGSTDEDDEVTQNGVPVLDRRTNLPIPAKSLGALVSLLRAAALDYDHVNAPFALVRALVARRAMVPEMYDLMEQMLGITVTSRRPTVRQMGGQIIVSFLLHYPLTSARVTAFLQQAVRNMGYEYEDGRAAALGLLQNLVIKLPGPVLDEHAQMLFLPMVLRLVNDPSPKTRAMAAEAIGALLKRVSGDVFHALLEYQCRWMGEREENEGLARAAAQGVGLFVDARPDLFKRGGEDGLGMELLVLLSETLASVEKRGPVSGVDTTDLEEPRERHGEAALGWEMAYHCLASLGRVYTKLPTMMEGFLHNTSEGMVLLSATSEIMCYRHAWVRLAASRFMGQYLDRRAAGGSGKTVTSAATLGSSPFLSEPANARALARRLCVQIDRPSLSPELSLRAVKSLVFLTSALAQVQEGEEGGKGVKTLSAGIPVCNGAEMELEEEEEEEEKKQEEDEGEVRDEAPKDLLSWIFHRVSYMARRKGEDRRCAAFRFFAAVATLESQATVERFLPHMLSPLYRATTDGQAEGSAHGNDAVELAKEIMGLIEEKAGATPFVQALSEIQKQAAQKRAGRKKARAIEAINDPEAAAKRKLAKNLMKRETAKRKKASSRLARGGGPGVDRASKRQRPLADHEGDKDQGM